MLLILIGAYRGNKRKVYYDNQKSGGEEFKFDTQGV